MGYPWILCLSQRSQSAMIPFMIFAMPPSLLVQWKFWQVIHQKCYFKSTDITQRLICEYFLGVVYSRCVCCVFVKLLARITVLPGKQNQKGLSTSWSVSRFWDWKNHRKALDTFMYVSMAFMELLQSRQTYMSSNYTLFKFFDYCNNIGLSRCGLLFQ